MSNLIGVLLLLIGTIPSFATGVDSLTSVLNQQKGSDRIPTLISLVKKQKDSVLAASYSNELLQLVPAVTKDSTEVRIHLTVGKWYQKHQSYALADEQFELAILASKSNKKLLAWAHLHIGNSIEERGDHKRAIQHFKADYAIRSELGQLREESRALNNIAISHWYQDELDSVMPVLRKTFAIDSATDNVVSMAAVRNTFGMWYTNKGQWQEAIYWYQEAIVLQDQLGDEESSALTKRNLAAIYSNAGVHDEALRLAFEVLPYFEEHNMAKPLAYTQTTIGNVYQKLNNHDLALEHFELALAIEVAQNDIRGQGTSWGNIGSLEDKCGNYEEALLAFEKALALKVEAGREQGSMLIHIGKTLVNINQVKKAEASFRAGIEAAVNGEDQQTESIGKNALASLLIDQGRLEEAEVLLNESRVLCERNKAREEQQINYGLTVKLLTLLGEYEQALEFASMQQTVKDSLLNTQNQHSIREMEIRYETNRQREENVRLLAKAAVSDLELALAAEKEAKQNNFIIGLTVIAALMLVLTAVFYKLYVDKRRSENKVKLLMRELHHRVKNNLQVLSSLLSLQSSRIEDKSVRQVVKGGEERVNAMMLIHQKLYKEEGLLDINMKEYVHKLTRSLMASYGIDQSDFKLLLEIDSLDLDVDKAIPLGLVINELVSNALKYAFEDNADPELVVILKETDKHAIQLEVRDNGSGFFKTPNINESETFGLKMVNILSKQLKGTLTCTNDSGLQYVLQFQG